MTRYRARRFFDLYEKRFYVEEGYVVDAYIGRK